MPTYFARAYRSRIEHLTADRVVTLCGKDAQLMAKFTASERGPDAVIRPLCEACRGDLVREVATNA